MLQPIIDTLIPLLPGWLELPESYVGLLKSASHRYIKRVPKPGGGYRYFYHVGHGGGVHAEDHFVPGASFRHEGGHYHIKSAEGGKLVIEHDETKERKTVSKAELRDMLGAHHEPAIKAHREKVAGMLAEARANKASPKQIAKLEARAKAAGIDTSPPMASFSRTPEAPAGQVPKSLYWTNEDKYGNPSDVGDIYKTKDGHYVVVTGHGKSRYTSATDNEDFYGHYGGATWTHESVVRPADQSEIEHYRAVTATDGTASHRSKLVPSPRAAGMQAAARAAEKAKQPAPKPTEPKPAAPTVQLPSADGGPKDEHHAAAARRGLTLTPARGGKSVHVTGNTFAHKDRIRLVGGKWDPDNKAWKVSLAALNAMLKGFRPSTDDAWGKAS